MARIRIFNIGGLNLKLSPFLHQPGDMVRMVNVKKDMVGAVKKRPGYVKYLGTPDNATVTSLWEWHRNNGTQFWNYRYSGSVLYYSQQGTGAFTVCGNGTMANGNAIGHAVLDDVMIIGDGVNATRHSTDGTSFTNTTNAPLAEYFETYQARVYAVRGTATSGTAIDLIYSAPGTATNWTNDSSSVRIPSKGRPNSLFKTADRLITTTDAGQMYKYDGFNMVDLATNLGPSTGRSIGEVEDFRFYLNRKGVFGFGGNRPEIISNPIERQIYNDAGEGITGGTFDNAPGIAYKFDYFLSAGTVTDDLTDETINNCILKYDYQLDEHSNYDFANLPTAWGTYKDASGNEQLIFGASNGQCYTFGGTALNDDGATIQSTMEGVLTFRIPDIEKKFNTVFAFANPGCEAKVMVALGDTFTKGKKKWIPLNDFHDGMAELRFPSGSQGRLMFWKVVEASRNARFQLYGFVFDLEPDPEKR